MKSKQEQSKQKLQSPFLFNESSYIKERKKPPKFHTINKLLKTSKKKKKKKKAKPKHENPRGLG